MVRLFFELFNYFPGSITASVIYKNDFVRQLVFLHHTLNPIVQLNERILFVVERYDN
ncbi:hypothetical protein SDC9_183635 [bioreactor metagenome]|uniref:Uncharacterized protein n=1 Tax=bioreactor metagenome TaxID=1076179 RepID=A0A645HDC9_9ZZZZ